MAMVTSKAQKGFSLIELMVVIFIIAIVSSGVSIAVSSVASPQKQLDETGRKLYAQMAFALDEALVTYQVIGLHIQQEADTETRYQWLTYQQEQWIALAEEPLNAVTLAEDMRIEMTVDNELLDTLLENALNTETDNEQEPIVPAVVFYPNGEVSDFELSLSLVNEDVNNFSIFLDDRKQLANSNQENADIER